MEVVPLSQFFVCTVGKEKNEFCAINWLNRIDLTILERIINSSELFFELQDGKEAPFECLDYLTLSYMIGEKECQEDSDNFSEKIKHNCLIGLSTFAYCEKLRREGILTITGKGKISEFHLNNTDIELTEMGKVVGSSMRTMREISDAVEKDRFSS